MSSKSEAITIERPAARCGSPIRGSCFFPEPGYTKLDLVNYYLECEEAVVRHLRERPTTMKRWVDGVTGEFFSRSVCPTALRPG